MARFLCCCEERATEEKKGNCKLQRAPAKFGGGGVAINWGKRLAEFLFSLNEGVAIKRNFLLKIEKSEIDPTRTGE